MHRRFLFIINLNTAPIGAREALESYFLEHGQYDHIYEPTATVGDVWRQIALHLHEIDGIITYGGDGTFHQALNVVNGLAEHPSEGRRVGMEGLIFGTLIGGSSGNDIGKALKMGDTRRELATGRELRSLWPIVESAVNNDYIKGFDIGYFQLPGQKRKVFFNILGAGYDAHVVQRAEELREGHLNYMPGFARFRYFLAALLSLFSHRPVGLKSLKINDIPVEVGGKVFMVTVMNSPVAGGGLTLNPFGRMDDKALDVVMLRDFSEPLSKLRLVGLLVGAFFGKPHIHHPKVQYFNNRTWNNEDGMESGARSNLEKRAVQKVEVEFQEGVHCHADGDILPDAQGYEAGLCPYQLQVITGTKNKA